MARNNDAFAVLADEHRRLVLQHLHNAENGIAAVDELVESAIDSGSVTERTSVRIRLHHATLPSLADEGYIDYKARGQSVRYRGDPSLDRILGTVAATTVTP